MKEVIGIVAVVLTFVGYVPYYRDLFRGKTHPHLYSWFLWALLTILIAALQFKGGAGPGTYITVAAGVLSVGVTYFGFKQGTKYITKFDTAVFILALGAIAFWLLADLPEWSIILAVIADVLAIAPTVRKTWHKPYTETLSLYVTNTFRFGFALLAIENYSLLATLWPAVWAVLNGGFALMIITRRQKLNPPPKFKLLP
ncbi:hypothetical protein KC878_02730 [Candidatus Saccharibacteria bacterium]|nr:hypothetical protein [Candidatus Saccharibacteria bacterium]MCB9821277.1 hypothetical protein [Candidatus Nomurabacteria bacterium]